MKNLEKTKKIYSKKDQKQKRRKNKKTENLTKRKPI